MTEEDALELDFEPMDDIGLSGTVANAEEVAMEKKPNLPIAYKDANEPEPGEIDEVPENSVINELSEESNPRKRRYISPPRFGDDDEEEEDEKYRKIPEHLAGRITRVRDYEEHDDRPKLAPLRTIARQDWGLEKPSKESEVTNEEIAKIYTALDVDLDDQRIQLDTIFVKGVDSMNEYEIEKIFAEYEPISRRPEVPVVLFVNRSKSECVLTFGDVYKVVEMFLGMSKDLKRIHPAKAPEEGEVVDSEDEEEGQVREENGEDVAVVQEAFSKSTASQPKDSKDDKDYVEIDVEKVSIPPGKWRVITKHVPGNRLIIARYAKMSEINQANRNPINLQPDRRVSDDKEDPDFNWESSKKDRVRPGLNIFDEKGHELDWDYEHDTRFYEDPNLSTKDSEEAPKEPDVVKVGNRVIQSRGRGAKKFVLKESSSEDED